jgi:hypothetical protein
MSHEPICRYILQASRESVISTPLLWVNRGRGSGLSRGDVRKHVRSGRQHGVRPVPLCSRCHKACIIWTADSILRADDETTAEQVS